MRSWVWGHGTAGVSVSAVAVRQGSFLFDLVAAAVEVSGRDVQRELCLQPWLTAACMANKFIDEVVEGGSDVLHRLANDHSKGWVGFDLEVPRRIWKLGVVHPFHPVGAV